MLMRKKLKTGNSVWLCKQENILHFQKKTVLNVVTDLYEVLQA